MGRTIIHLLLPAELSAAAIQQTHDTLHSRAAKVQEDEPSSEWAAAGGASAALLLIVPLLAG